jgi:predicted nucleotide-binding protein (sugar kinase/HSP70/actin superfamily)
LNEDQADLEEDRIKVGTDQAMERADLTQEQRAEQAKQNKKLAEQRSEDAEDVQKAEAKVNERRNEIAKDSREELTELDERTVALRSKAEAADAKTRAAASSTLAEVPQQRAAITADIDALETVKAENLSRVKSDLKKRLSALDETLDQAESKF